MIPPLRQTKNTIMNRKTAAVTALVVLCAVHVSRTASAQSAATVSGRTATVSVPVATRDIPRGRLLVLSDIRWVDTAGVAESSSDSARVEAGWVTRRNFRAGEMLRSPGVSLPDLVSSGDEVNVVYSAPGVNITVRGTAIGNGARGEQVYVKLENRKRLRGTVAGANTVRVM